MQINEMGSRRDRYAEIVTKYIQKIENSDICGVHTENLSGRHLANEFDLLVRVVRGAYKVGVPSESLDRKIAIVYLDYVDRLREKGADMDLILRMRNSYMQFLIAKGEWKKAVKMTLELDDFGLRMELLDEARELNYWMILKFLFASGKENEAWEVFCQVKDETVGELPVTIYQCIYSYLSKKGNFEQISWLHEELDQLVWEQPVNNVGFAPYRVLRDSCWGDMVLAKVDKESVNVCAELDKITTLTGKLVSMRLVAKKLVDCGNISELEALCREYVALVEENTDWSLDDSGPISEVGEIAVKDKRPGEFNSRDKVLALIELCKVLAKCPQARDWVLGIIFRGDLKTDALILTLDELAPEERVWRIADLCLLMDEMGEEDLWWRLIKQFSRLDLLDRKAVIGQVIDSVYARNSLWAISLLQETGDPSCQFWGMRNIFSSERLYREGLLQLNDWEQHLSRLKQLGKVVKSRDVSDVGINIERYMYDLAKIASKMGNLEIVEQLVLSGLWDKYVPGFLLGE